MMRIAYVFAGADLQRSAGVSRKISSQVAVWRRHGHDVRLFLQVRSHRGSRRADYGDHSVVLFADDERAGGTRWTRVGRRLAATEALAISVSGWCPDIVYLRYTVHYPALKRIATVFPTVVEINSDDLSEYQSQFPLHKYLYHRVTRGRLLSRVCGAVFVTRELAALPHFDQYRKASAVIPNGIALQDIRPRAATWKARPRLVFIGEPGLAWHGVDKLVRLARACRDWDFDVIGYASPDVDERPSENVRLHGYLERERYTAIMSDADVAIGTLALHRKGMNEACALKVREYMAYGVPTIVGCRDADFPDPPWFLLQLPNTLANVDANIEEIRAFVKRVRGARVPREDIGHLDVEVKEESRLRFFEAIVGNGPAVAPPCGSPVYAGEG